MLADAVAEATAEANLVGLALSAGVPGRLLAAGGDPNGIRAAADAAVHDLERTSSVQRGDAAWVVSAVAEALGLQAPAATTPDAAAADELTVRAMGRSVTVRPGGEIVIGRSPDCAIVLDSPAVSRRHARLEHRPAGWVYVDLRSTQGSFVERAAVGEVPVGDGLVVVLGQGPEAVRLELVVARTTRLREPHAPMRPPPGPTVLPGGSGRPGGALAPGGLPATELGRGGADALTVTFAGATRTLSPGTVLTIGRDPANDLVAAESTVSRRHVQIEFANGTWHLRDLGTTSGTWSGGQRVSDVPLAGRQEFRLGDAVNGPVLGIVSGAGDAFAGGTGPAPTRRGRPSRLVVGIAAAVVLALVAGLAVWLVSRGDESGDSKTSNDDLARATVRLSTDEGTGSGVVIDKKQGLILTNAHVAAPAAVGLAASGLEFSDGSGENPKDIVVSVSGGLGHAAEPRFTANLVAADGYLDVAVVKIDRTLSGSQVEADELAALTQVRIGDSDAVKTSDRVAFFGYPGAAKSKEPTYTSGVVSGAVKDGRLGTNRAALNSTATISGGNSGGLAADEKGRMIGVPTWARLDREGQTVFSSFRPINLAKPVIEAAEKGRTYTSPWSSAGPEGASVTDFNAAAPGAPGSVHAGCAERSGTGPFALGLDVTGFPSGKHTDVMAAVYEDTGEGPGDLITFATTTLEEDYPVALPPSGCITFTFDTRLDPGEYLLRVGVGGDLRIIDSERFTIS